MKLFGKYKWNLRMSAPEGFPMSINTNGGGSGKREVKPIIEAEDQKVIQVGKAYREKSREYKGLFNQDAVDFIQYPNGEKGIRVHLNDGTTEYWMVNVNGEMTPMIEYKDSYHPNFFWDKVERFFGITPQMRLDIDKRIDYIHAAMFLTGAAILGGIVAGISYGLNLLLN